jgi:GNAT superfamily N-acetyltransferase
MVNTCCLSKVKSVSVVVPADLKIRPAIPGDVGNVLGLFDEAIEWFKTFGNTRQWGVEPFSQQPRQVDRVTGWLEARGAWMAELPGIATAGVLVLGAKHDYIPAVKEDELYVRLLLGSRRSVAKGTGRALLAFADRQARITGVSLLRVDCYNGGTGRLAQFYESCGYERTEQFHVGEWPGQILQRRVDRE